MFIFYFPLPPPLSLSLEWFHLALFTLNSFLLNSLCFLLPFSYYLHIPSRQSINLSRLEFLSFVKQNKRASERTNDNHLTFCYFSVCRNVFVAHDWIVIGNAVVLLVCFHSFITLDHQWQRIKHTIQVVIFDILD